MNVASEPLVSVITSAYNSERHIARCIDSVRRQTYQNIEHIIVDAGSDDQTFFLAKQIGASWLRLVKAPYLSVSAARNIAAEKARGVFLAVLDTDDTWSATKIAEQVAFLLRHEKVAAVGTGFLIATENDGIASTRRISYPTASADIEALLLCGINPVPHSSLVVRRESFQACRGYLESTVCAEDYSLMLRLVPLGGTAILNRCLTYINIREGSYTSRQNIKDLEGHLLQAYSSALNDVIEPSIVNRWNSGDETIGISTRKRWRMIQLHNCNHFLRKNISLKAKLWIMAAALNAIQLLLHQKLWKR